MVRFFLFKLVIFNQYISILLLSYFNAKKPGKISRNFSNIYLMFLSEGEEGGWARQYKVNIDLTILLSKPRHEGCLFCVYYISNHC